MSRLFLAWLLAALGRLLDRASRKSAGFRSALSRDRVIAFETDDGVAYHFAAQGRSLRATRGPAPEVDFRIRFATAREALGMLLGRNGVGRMLSGMERGSIGIEGDLLLFLWFQGRLEEATPFSARRRRAQRFPGAYTAPRNDIAAARWIRREPAVADLDPAWTAAAHQREKLLMMRVAAGEKALPL